MKRRTFALLATAGVAMAAGFGWRCSVAGFAAATGTSSACSPGLPAA